MNLKKLIQLNYGSELVNYQVKRTQNISMLRCAVRLEGENSVQIQDSDQAGELELILYEKKS